MPKIIKNILSNPIQIVLVYILISQLFDLVESLLHFRNEKKTDAELELPGKKEIDGELPELSTCDPDLRRKIINLLDKINDIGRGGVTLVSDSLEKLLEKTIRLAKKKKEYVPLATFVAMAIQNRDNQAAINIAQTGDDPIVIYFIIAETFKGTIADTVLSRLECIGSIDTKISPKLLKIITSVVGLTVTSVALIVVTITGVNVPRNIINITVFNLRRKLASLLFRLGRWICPNSVRPAFLKKFNVIDSDKIVIDEGNEPLLLEGRTTENDLPIIDIEAEMLEHNFETTQEDNFMTMKKFVDPVVETPSRINRASAKKIKIPLKDRTKNFLDLVEDFKECEGSCPIRNDEVRSLGREELRRQNIIKNNRNNNN